MFPLSASSMKGVVGPPDLKSPEDRALWGLLDEDSRTLARKRLQALAAHEASGDARTRAEEAGLSLNPFFIMLRRWRKEPGLEAVLPFMRGQARSPRELDGPAVDALKRIAERTPGIGKEKLVIDASASMRSPPSANTMGLIADRVVAALERERLGGEKGFGRLVVAATCSARLRPAAGIERLPAAHAGFVVDVPTGAILGTSLHARPLVALRAAVAEALQTSDGTRDEALVGAPDAVLEAYLGDDAVAAMRWVVAARSTPGLEVHGRQRDGEIRLVRLLGPRLGTLDLRASGAGGDASSSTGDEVLLLARRLRLALSEETDELPERTSKRLGARVEGALRGLMALIEAVVTN